MSLEAHMEIPNTILEIIIVTVNDISSQPPTFYFCSHPNPTWSASTEKIRG